MRDSYTVIPSGIFTVFNPERDAQIAHQKLAAISFAIGPRPKADLFARGGKLILYHGWNDAAIPALATVDYYQRVIDTIGEEKANKGVRLFMAPGMLHCDSGPGPNSFRSVGRRCWRSQHQIGRHCNAGQKKESPRTNHRLQAQKNDDDDAKRSHPKAPSLPPTPTLHTFAVKAVRIALQARLLTSAIDFQP